jgi:hypothetical protein
MLSAPPRCITASRTQPVAEGVCCSPVGYLVRQPQNERPPTCRFSPADTSEEDKDDVRA